MTKSRYIPSSSGSGFQPWVLSTGGGLNKSRGERSTKTENIWGKTNHRSAAVRGAYIRDVIGTYPGKVGEMCVIKNSILDFMLYRQELLTNTIFIHLDINLNNKSRRLTVTFGPSYSAADCSNIFPSQKPHNMTPSTSGWLKYSVITS